MKIHSVMASDYYCTTDQQCCCTILINRLDILKQELIYLNFNSRKDLTYILLELITGVNTL